MTKLALVLGDQLSLDNPALLAIDTAKDAVLMAEVHAESTHVWSHKARIAVFLSAMRHFAEKLRGEGFSLTYFELTENAPSFTAAIERTIQTHPEITELVVTQPGDWRVEQELRVCCERNQIQFQVLEDTHFLYTIDQFKSWAKGRKDLRMEYFYREMRKRHKVLLETDGEPLGGQWNFDADNREGFPKSGPGNIPTPASFKPDKLTREVFDAIETHFPTQPGSLEHFAWPVTREQALLALDRFIDARLERFGPHQDAMWTDTPFGWHSLISGALNLHLLHPLEVVQKVEAAYRKSANQLGAIHLASAEGFIRQVLGWREFIRGVYWLDMPEMAKANHYEHERKLPAWYWTANTKMACMKDCIDQTLKYGYAHHIQRLMVTGQFSLLAELRPQEVSAWYLAVYVDAVEWAELPNVAGMALFANGGRFTSKPYIASGQYIKRMSNYCKGCVYKPDQKIGEAACPVTTLFWYFLDKHEATLAKNPRTALMAKNITRLDATERQALRTKALHTLEHLDSL